MNQNKPGFFARKYNPSEESLLTIFKTPKIWGALLGEMLGALLLTMLLMCTIGMFRVDFVPIFLMAAVVSIYLIIAKLSGANLNPLITVGMMATRRMSAIRGVLYILAQVVGAWIASLILNGFRLGGGSDAGVLPELVEATGENFWALAFISLLCAIILAFCFARALRYAKKNILAFAFTVSSSIVLVYLLSVVIAQNFFGLTENIIFNPAAALMYGILPTTAENLGALMSAAGLALTVYVFVPMVGGIIGFYLSDIAARLAGPHYVHSDDSCSAKCACHDTKELTA